MRARESVRGRESVFVCVYVCGREREREREPFPLSGKGVLLSESGKNKLLRNWVILSSNSLVMCARKANSSTCPVGGGPYVSLSRTLFVCLSDCLCLRL